MFQIVHIQTIELRDEECYQHKTTTELWEISLKYLFISQNAVFSYSTNKLWLLEVSMS